ncbi:hypothetical protein AB2T90_19590 [Clostridium butyricum]|uniref:hypothetical protein n=1 Tax=Clostridium butyricum TaxID=1492 RepID=UPI003464F7F0
MNNIIVYNTTNGKILSTQELNTDSAYLVVDIPTDKKIIKINIETKEPIFDDTDEIKAQKQKLQDDINKKQFDIQAKQLEMDKANYNLLKQQSEIVDIAYTALDGDF